MEGHTLFIAELNFKINKNLPKYSSLPIYIMTIYHVIEGVFFALNWNTFRGEACVQLMHGEPSKGKFGLQFETTLSCSVTVTLWSVFFETCCY